MTNFVNPFAEPHGRDAPPRRRWSWHRIAAIALTVPAVLTLVAVAGFVVWSQVRSYTARRQLEQEVRRIHSAGEPITIDDLHAYHAVAPDEQDVTGLWIAALESFDERRFTEDGKSLPVVGHGKAELLTASAEDSLLQDAKSFLVQYDSTIRKAIVAAEALGECRFPIRFEDGLEAQLPHAEKMRYLARLFALRLQISRHQRHSTEAIESLEVLIAAANTMFDQILIVDQLVGMAVAGVAMHNGEELLNARLLSDAELSHVARLIGSLDVERGLTNGTLGQRAMGYYIFHNLDLIASKGDDAGLRGKGLTRPVDLCYFLSTMRDYLEASRRTYPEALDEAQGVQDRLMGMNRIEQLSYLVTLLLAPAYKAAFEAAATNVAHRELLVAAISAERYRRTRGQLPASLEDLVPDYLDRFPRDPFDGQALRMIASSDEVVIYSIGRNGIDDGGESDPQRNREPDIIVRLK